MLKTVFLRFSSIITLFLILLAFQLGSVQAAAPQHVDANFVSEDKAAVKGSVFWVGIHQMIEPKWHTYWKNPGDSGLETRINWDLPEGVTAGEIVWPTPKPIPFNGLMNFGYEGDVLLAVPLMIDEDVVGDRLDIKLDATWLVCKETCIPESQSFSKTVDLLPKGDTAAASVNAILFEQARDNWPIAYDYPSFYRYNEQGDFILRLADFEQKGGLNHVYFYPYEWGVINYNVPQSWSFEQGEGAFEDTKSLVLKVPSEHQFDGEAVQGVLALEFDQMNVSYEIRALKDTQKDAQILASATKTKPSGSSDIRTAQPSLSLFMTALYAFIGGLILNLMPCVFPVLSMKALSLIGHQDQAASKRRISGLGYLAGVLTTFLAIGGVLIGLQAAGQGVGWGFQLQSPIFISVMIILFFLIAMNMAGFFEIGTRLMRFGGRFSVGEGFTGSFMTGLLAVIVATPCTAPFMASALGATLILPPIAALSVFAFLGLGLAFPYLLLTFVPHAARLMPKPGAWMESFRQFLAFPMLAAMLWLAFVLLGQAGGEAVIAVLGVGILALFFFWLLGRSETMGTAAKIVFGNVAILSFWVLIYSLNYIDLSSITTWASLIGATIIALILLWRLPVVSIFYWLVFVGLASYLLVVGFVMQGQTAKQASLQTQSQTVDYIAYDADRLAQLRAEGKKVFVNMTADWCITCLANERAALSTEKVRDYFQENEIIYMKGDWTNYDEAITKFLNDHGRNGVPLYVYYSGDEAEAKILPQLLTPDLVTNSLSVTND